MVVFSEVIMLGLMGKKLGMAQIFNDAGDAVTVTVVKLGPCTVVQKKNSESDGYNALQLGFGLTKPKRMPKARRGHLEKRGMPLFSTLKEFRIDDVSGFEVGQELCAAGFKAGDTVDVSGTTKGRGFQGVIKRHGKHGGPASHGSDFHRRPGSIGMRTWPGHVLKNMKLPGHMGNVTVTTRNLEIVGVRPDDDVVLIGGALPGWNNGMVVVLATEKDFEKRPELKRGGATQAVSEEAKEASA
jgi:50S ribosomal protein L3, bacterial